MWGACLYAGVVHYGTGGREPFTLSHGGPDWSRLKPAAESKEIEYPKPDNVVSFDLLSSVALTGTNHEGDQPAHLRVRPELAHVPNDVSIKEYAGPELSGYRLEVEVPGEYAVCWGRGAPLPSEARAQNALRAPMTCAAPPRTDHGQGQEFSYLCWGR